MSEPRDRDHRDGNYEDGIQGSGYFDKSVESLEVPPPEIVDSPAADAQSQGSGPDITDAATAYLDEFPD
ncbi:hypothetical protein [Gordonia hongkongensis]|uniref:hypothetical protein n=1 Tax=Gordonia hongkongensis TaxID=1701090 RepID=UPI003EBBBE86